MRFVPMILVVAGFAGGCGDAGAGAVAGAGDFEVRDSAGVRIIINHVTGDDVPLGVDEVLRIGAIEGEEAYMFSRIAAMAADAGGNLYVANSESGTVRVFAPDGRFLREFGGRGTGPAGFHEFSSVSVAGDTVAVLGDGAGPKAVLFSRRGDLLESWSMVRLWAIPAAPLSYQSTGWIGIRGAMPRMAEPGTEMSLPRDVLRVFPESDSIGPTLVSLPAFPLHANARGEPISGLFRIFTLPAVDSAGRIYFASDSMYRIDVYGPDGSHALRVIRDIDPVPVGPSDVEEAVVLAAARWDTMTMPYGVDRATMRERYEASIRERAEFVPTHIPPVRRLQVRTGGGFWAGRTDPQHLAADGIGPLLASDLPHTTRWDIFDANGLYRQTVELPPRFTPLIVTDSSATGVEKDEFDVEYVVTYRVRAR